MSILVLSCGRTGTNVALSVLLGSKSLSEQNYPKLHGHPHVENKKIFREVKSYPANYLAKSDVDHLDHFSQLQDLMDTNPQMQIVWTIRDPRDVMLSKIRRGQSRANGGDTELDWASSDATPSGAVQSMDNMLQNYLLCEQFYSERSLLVKMEDLLLFPEKTIRRMCKNLNLPYESSMVNFPSRMRNHWKAKRYGNSIDTSQVGLWKRWKKIYGGFFTKENLPFTGPPAQYPMDLEFLALEPFIKFFNYDFQ